MAITPGLNTASVRHYAQHEFCIAAFKMATEAKDQKSYALLTVTPKHDDIEEGQITSTLDEAELFLHEHGISHAQLQEMLSDETRSKKLRRRIDLILLPLLCGTYVLQYIDKQVCLLHSGEKNDINEAGSLVQCGL